MNERNAAVCLWLWDVLGFDMKKTADFLLTFSDPVAGYELAVRGELDPEIFPCRDLEKVTAKNLDSYASDLKYYADKNIDVITFYDKEYPMNLALSETPPPVLFVRGKIPETYKKPSVSLVGTRACTPSGAKFCARMAYGLALHGFAVASGISEGIESFALAGALQAPSATPTAVVPTSLDKIYPRESEYLCDFVAERGAAISVFPSDAKVPIRMTFTVANYVLAAISHGTILFEASPSSGSLSDVKAAKRQGKLLFAVPGQPGNHASDAANELIKKGARVCTGLNDVIDTYNEVYSPLFGGKIEKLKQSNVTKQRQSLKKREKDEQEKLLAALDETERKVLSGLTSPKPVDALCDELDISFPEIATALQSLELQGLVKNTEDGYVSSVG